jgi:hypothetical protein
MTIEIKSKFLFELFQLVKPDMSENSAGFILELIDANEWGIALEFIYDFLDDEEVSISRHIYNLIQQLATMMEMDTRDWQAIESQILGSK